MRWSPVWPTCNPRNYWPQWRAVQCPMLVVRGEHGLLPQGHGNDIVQQLPGAPLVSIPDAGHDVHSMHPKLGSQPFSAHRPAVSQAGCGGGFFPWFRPRERRAFWDVTIEEVPRGVVGARDAAGV